MESLSKKERKVQYKNRIHEQVNKYLADKDHKEPNSGQLKFLKNLMIRSLAISTRVRIHKPKQLFDFLDKNILKYSDEVISFFNEENNIDAFLNSPHGYSLKPLRPLKVQFGHPPFLLLQKTQDVMEQALLDYVKEPFDDEKEKVKSYKNLLFSVTLYEIFLREFCKDLNDDYLKRLDMLADDINERGQKLHRMGEKLEDILEDKLLTFKNEEELNDLIGPIVTQTQNTSDYIFAASLISAYILYFYQHQANFYAMLRIISLIEFVNINLANNQDSTSNDRQDYLKKAKDWCDKCSEYTKEWAKNGDLFSIHAQNKNMGILYNVWNHMYHEYISPDSDKPEEQLECVWNYLDALEKYRVSKCKYYKTAPKERVILGCLEGITYEQKKEKLCQNADKLARPIYKATNAIYGLFETVREEKEKRNSKIRTSPTDSGDSHMKG